MADERRKEASGTSNRSTRLPGLRTARRNRGLTQRELARLAKVGTGTVSDLESGRRGAYPKTTRRIADGLELKVEELTE